MHDAAPIRIPGAAGAVSSFPAAHEKYYNKSKGVCFIFSIDFFNPKAGPIALLPIIFPAFQFNQQINEMPCLFQITHPAFVFPAGHVFDD
jgi:hypothetical protein